MYGKIIMRNLITASFLICFAVSSFPVQAEEYIRDGFHVQFLGDLSIGKITKFEVGSEYGRRGIEANRIFDVIIANNFSYLAEIDIGYTFFNKFIPHVSFFHTDTISSRAGGGRINANDPIRLYLQGWGLGVTYYFMPSNIFISAGFKYVMSGRLSPIIIDKLENDPTIVSDSSAGVVANGHGLSFVIGKEFWMSSDFSIGIAFINQYYNFEVKRPYTNLQKESLRNPRSEKFDYGNTYGVGVTISYN